MKKRTRILFIAVTVVCVILLAVVIGEVVTARLRTKPIYGIPLGGPAPVATGSSYSFAFTGDTRNNDVVLQEIIREAIGQKCAFSVYGGDLVKGSNDRDYEDFCQAVIKATGGGFPIYPVIGNHDWGSGITEKLEGDKFVKYLGPENYIFWYGRDAFVVFDDSRPEGFTSKNAAPVEKMLKEARGKARHLFMVCHIPPCDPDAARAHCLGPTSAKRLIVLAKKYHPSLLLCSHIHGYGEETEDGVHVVISGGAGAKLVSGGRFNWVKITVDDKGATPQMVELPKEFQNATEDVGAAD